MPLQIPNNCEFVVEREDQALLQTRTNGDTIIFSGIVLTQEQATILAWLFNSPKKLSIEVKELDEPLEPPD